MVVSCADGLVLELVTVAVRLAVFVPLTVDTAVGRSDTETPARPQMLWMAGAIAVVVVNHQSPDIWSG